MPESASVKTKRRVVALLQEGQTHLAIAREVGTSRQYVSYVAKTYEEKGEAIFSTRRGRTRDVPLQASEKEELQIVLTQKTPKEVGLDSDLWDYEEIQGWFRNTYQRMISRNQIRRFCTEKQIPLRSPVNPSSRSTKDDPESRAPSSTPAPRATEEEEDLEDWEAIRRSVAETQARLARTSSETQPGIGPGKRRGKHRKQKQAPFTRPRKKKRKKRK